MSDKPPIMDEEDAINSGREFLPLVEWVMAEKRRSWYHLASGRFAASDYLNNKYWEAETVTGLIFDMGLEAKRLEAKRKEERKPVSNKTPPIIMDSDDAAIADHNPDVTKMIRWLEEEPGRHLHHLHSSPAFMARIGANCWE